MMTAEEVQVHPFQDHAHVPDYCTCGWHRESRCHGVEPRGLWEIAKASDWIFYSLQCGGADGDKGGRA